LVGRKTFGLKMKKNYFAPLKNAGRRENVAHFKELNLVVNGRSCELECLVKDMELNWESGIVGTPGLQRMVCGVEINQ
jgi:hypothetical protein